MEGEGEEDTCMLCNAAFEKGEEVAHSIPHTVHAHLSQFTGCLQHSLHQRMASDLGQMRCVPDKVPAPGLITAICNCCCFH
jgi:hypothetical protein